MVKSPGERRADPAVADRPAGLPGRIHPAWIVMAAGFVVGTVAYGIYFSFGIFYPAIVAETGWSRGVVSGAFSISLATYSIFAVPMGYLVDRFGPRVAVMIGGVFFGAGTLLGAFISEPWHLYVLYGVVTAIGMGAAYVPLVSTVARWFVRHRGLAVGIASLGSGAGTFFVTPIVARVIEAVGWRGAYVAAGIAGGLLIVGFGWLLWRDPSDRGRAPYGVHLLPGRAAGAAPPAGVAVGAALRSADFWIEGLMYSFWWFASLIVYVLGADYALSRGADPSLAALLLTAIGLGNAIGKVFWGIAGDRLGPRPTFLIATGIELAMMVTLIFMSAPVFLIIVAAVLAFGFGGGSPQFPTITTELFGVRRLAQIFGCLFALVGIVGAGGPVLGGWLFDRTGSYQPALIAGAVALVISIGLCRLLPPPLDRRPG